MAPLLFFTTGIKAQSDIVNKYNFDSQENQDPFSCGTPESSGTSSATGTGATHHCFDVADIQSSCTQVWIKVNFHFFLEDDCSGFINPLGNSNVPASDAYFIAENLIGRSNAALDNNPKQFNQEPLWDIAVEKPAQCMPLRYVLSGVFVHCNSTSKHTSGGNIAHFMNNYSVNPDTEFNAFFVNYVGGFTGRADAIPGIAITTEDFSWQTFNHEMGHALDLRHTFRGDFLDDTPQIRFQFDFNCDGDLQDSWFNPGVGSESQWRTCWTYQELGEGPAIDYDGGGVDYPEPCDMPAPCTESWPCCNWDYLDNNIMSYSAYKAAYTEGQITRILENLSTDDYCDYIEEITSDCPPPMSNIHIKNGEEANGCTFCFEIGASMHDDYYNIDFFDDSGDLIYSTDWRDGPALRYCISRTIGGSHEYLHGFKADMLYTAMLSVENTCGDIAKESITFTLPKLPGDKCELESETGSNHEDSFIKIKSVYPNPFSHSITVGFEAKTAGEAEVWLYLATSMDQKYLMESKGMIGKGDHTGNYDTSALPPGLYYVVVSLDGEYAYESLLKL